MSLSEINVDISNNLVNINFSRSDENIIKVLAGIFFRQDSFDMIEGVDSKKMFFAKEKVGNTNWVWRRLYIYLHYNQDELLAMESYQNHVFGEAFKTALGSFVVKNKLDGQLSDALISNDEDKIIELYGKAINDEEFRIHLLQYIAAAAIFVYRDKSDNLNFADFQNVYNYEVSPISILMLMKKYDLSFFQIGSIYMYFGMSESDKRKFHKGVSWIFDDKKRIMKKTFKIIKRVDKATISKQAK